MSPAIEAMRGLADTGPIMWPLLQATAWVVGVSSRCSARWRCVATGRLPKAEDRCA
jgi:hypothetical protein